MSHTPRAVLSISTFNAMTCPDRGPAQSRLGLHRCEYDVWVHCTWHIVGVRRLDSKEHLCLLQAVDPCIDEPLHVPLADVLELIQAPGRAKRPKRIAIIIRGVPGSGKSYLARKLRDAELAAGREAPRIHSIDDYFVTVSRSCVMIHDVLGRPLA